MPHATSLSLSLEKHNRTGGTKTKPSDVESPMFGFEAGGRTRILSLGIGHDPESGVFQLTDKAIPWVLHKENKPNALGTIFLI